jgi:hypothetical protein
MRLCSCSTTSMAARMAACGRTRSACLCEDQRKWSERMCPCYRCQAPTKARTYKIAHPRPRAEQGSCQLSCCAAVSRVAAAMPTLVTADLHPAVWIVTVSLRCASRKITLCPNGGSHTAGPLCLLSGQHIVHMGNLKEPHAHVCTCTRLQPDGIGPHQSMAPAHRHACTRSCMTQHFQDT